MTVSVSNINKLEQAMAKYNMREKQYFYMIESIREGEEINEEVQDMIKNDMYFAEFDVYELTLDNIDGMFTDMTADDLIKQYKLNPNTAMETMKQLISGL